MAVVSVRAEITPKLLASLRFERQVIEKNGELTTRKTPTSVRYWYIADTQQDRLTVRVRPASITYYVRQRNGTKQLDRKLGQYPDMSITEARARARKWGVLIQDGQDPSEIRANRARERDEQAVRNTLTFARAYEAWMVTTRKSISDSTDVDRRKLVGWLDGSPIWSRSLWDIDRASVAAVMGPLGEAAAGGKRVKGWGPVSVSWSTVTKIFTHAQQAFAHQAKAHGIITHREQSPWALWREDNKEFFPRVEGRTTHLRTDETTGNEWLSALVRLYDATHAPDIVGGKISVSSESVKPWTNVLVDYVLCLLLWGTRRAETASLRWTDVRLEIGVVVIRADETKSGRPHHVPLTPWSRAILEARRRDNALWRPDEESPWVFPSVKHGKHIDGANGVIDELGEGTGERITAHDLRRTLATDMMEFATEADRLGKILAVGAMLNHAGADRGGVNAITIRYIQRWADALRPLYQRRETKLRRLAGLDPLVQDDASPAIGDDAALRAAIQADPARAARILAEVMAG